MPPYYNEFRKYLSQELKCSSNTKAAYLKDISDLAAFASAIFMRELPELNQDDLQNYLNTVVESGKSSSTVRRISSALKCYYSFLLFNHVLSESPAHSFILPKSERRSPSFLTTDEVDQLLRQPKFSDPKGFRDKAMLELLYATGIHVSELIALNIADVNLKASCIRCMKGENSRIIPIYPAAVNSLSYYMKSIRPKFLQKKDENALFLNMNGSRMTRQGFWKILKFYADEAHISKDISPNTLRHSFAMHLIQNGADNKFIQDILGYKDISSTEFYSRMFRQNIQNKYMKFHPKA